MQKEKFDYGIDFQELILQFTIHDRYGYKALELYDDSYFTLFTHSLIVVALKRFYKKKKRIPSEQVLNELLREMYISTRYAAAVSEQDKKDIAATISNIYKGPPKDSDEILEKVITFARYVSLKDEIEKVNALDVSSYNDFSEKIKASINIGNDINSDEGIFLIRDHKERSYHRQDYGDVCPTPFWQLNRLLNGGGLTKGSIVMIASKAKRFKTGMLINWARMSMRRKKNVLYIDFENGERAITTRTEQSISGLSQGEVNSGEGDEKLSKVMRKLKRLGVEMIVRRLTAYRDNAHTIKYIIDEVYQKYGIKINILVVDFADLAASTTKREADDQRISDVYVDLKNLGKDADLDYILTASHVNRKGYKNIGTKFQPDDLAKCIDKINHVDMALGLQESEDEEEAGVMRLEIMDQRNGPADGQVLMWVDIEKQRAKEFSKKEVAEYRKQMGLNPDGSKPKAEKHTDL